MKKIAALFTSVCLGLAVASGAWAKEDGGHKEGDKGTIAGKIVKKDGAKITVKGESETLTLMPYWRGGMPKDGGGFDKEMVAKLKKLETGDRVKAQWTFQEHCRIDAIDRLEGGDREHPRKEK